MEFLDLTYRQDKIKGGLDEGEGEMGKRLFMTLLLLTDFFLVQIYKSSS